MINQQKQRVAPNWLRRASWLALVSLAWMQLAFAGHQFEHSAGYADSCDACVQFDRLDDTVAESPVGLDVLRPAGHTASLRSDTLTSVLTVAAFNPRAPPVI